MADAVERLGARFQELLDSGWSAEDITRHHRTIAAETLGPGPWSDEDGGAGFVGPDEQRQLPDPNRRRDPPPKPSLFAGVPGAASDAADFARGAGNAFVGRSLDAASWGLMSPEARYKAADEEYRAARLISQNATDPAHAAHGRAKMQRALQALQSAKQELADTKEHGVASFLGSAAGSVVGPGGAVANSITAIPRATRGLAAVGKGVAAGGLGGAVDASGRTLWSGGTATEAAEHGALGLMLGGTLGGVAPALNQRLHDPLTETGRTLRALQRGAPFLASPQFRNLPKGEPGIGHLAYDEGERLGQIQHRELRAARARAEAGEAASPLGMDEPMDVRPIHDRLARSVDRYSNEEDLVRPDSAREVANTRRVLSREFEPDDGSGGGLMPPDETGRLPIATQRDVVARRRAVRQMAEPGLPMTPQNAPFREHYQTLSEASHAPGLPGNVGEHWQGVDAQFSADMDRIAAGNELLFGRDNARAVTDSIGASKGAASRLGQSLRDTRAGGAQLRILEQIRELGPEYAESVDRVAAKIAFEGTRFGPPQTLSHPGKWALNLPLQNARAANVQLVEPLTASPRLPAAAGASLAPLLRDPVDALLTRKRKEKKE